MPAQPGTPSPEFTERTGRIARLLHIRTARRAPAARYGGRP